MSSGGQKSAVVVQGSVVMLLATTSSRTPPIYSPSKWSWSCVSWKKTRTWTSFLFLYGILSAVVIVYLQRHNGTLLLLEEEEQQQQQHGILDTAAAGVVVVTASGPENRKHKNRNSQNQIRPPRLLHKRQRRQQMQQIMKTTTTAKKAFTTTTTATTISQPQQLLLEYHTPKGTLPNPVTMTMTSQERTEQQQQQQNLNQPLQQTEEQQQPHTFAPYQATLNCDAHGGPPAHLAQEMVYWKHIPADYQVLSPYFRRHLQSEEQFLTFEPDNAGWNNIRMAWETIVAVAFALGRTLVLPPEQEVWNMNAAERPHPHSANAAASSTTTTFINLITKKKKQKAAFAFNDIFHLQEAKHKGLKVITTKEFLERQIMTSKNGSSSLNSLPHPPGNRTDWNGAPLHLVNSQLFAYYRQHFPNLQWDPDHCQLALENLNNNNNNNRSLDDVIREFMQKEQPRWFHYVGNPVPVDGSTVQRLRESRGQRNSPPCRYTVEQQEQVHLHYPSPPRLLLPYYAFVFFQDWNYQLFLNRMIRDAVRYSDEITCAAARVVAAIRKRVEERTGGGSNNKNDFDAIHIRRQDFRTSYKETHVDIHTIYTQLSRVLPPHDPNVTLYIATDEKNHDFFDELAKHYDIVFLHTFQEELADVNTNYYGMIEQVIASRSRYFFGCYYSTFSAYINRLRGYHHDKNKAPGYEHGIIHSWYYAPVDRFDEMQHYEPLRVGYWEREFPMGWRLSDYKMEEFHKSLAWMQDMNKQ